jgi:Fe-S-cluster containining protein
LKRDSDEDFVLKSSPCAFLGEDNFCSIYDVRPKACQEFPHTDRRRQHQILDLTRKNSEVCPAVFEIVDKLKKQLKLHKTVKTGNKF